MAGLAMGAVAVVSCLAVPRGTLTDYFLQSDRLWLVVGAAALLLTRTPVATRAWARAAEIALRRPRLIVAVAAATTFAVSAASAFLVFHGYGLSRDEAMADFDAAILRGGHLVAPVAQEWRAFVPALEPEFLLSVSGNAGWISDYLPGNATLRALFGLFADPRLLNAALAALAVVAVAGIARRLWPDRPQAAIVATLLLASSSQLLVTAATPYAMTAHLAFNLAWLWLFLRGGRLAHAGAIAIGFVASGLHQIVFHPLFVAPFIVRLWLDRRWTTAATYSAAYLLIGIFWIHYRQLALDAGGFGGGADVGGGFLARQIVMLLQSFGWSALELMAKNLIRFVAWQNPLTVPLAVVALASLRRSDGILWCLVWGVALTLAAAFVMMPYQGHGWGYRYLHGLMGSICLLAAAGWTQLADRAPGRQHSASSAFGWPTVIALVLMLPGHLLEASAFADPYARASAAISRAPADLVLVDSDATVFGADLVRNDPYLRNRPKIMLLARLSRSQVADLCGRFRVELFGSPQIPLFGLPQIAAKGRGSNSIFAGTRCAPQPPFTVPVAAGRHQ